MSDTFYDDPNRQSVGLDPIWTGADGSVVVPAKKAAKKAAATEEPADE